MPDRMIELLDVSKTFDTVEALRHLSLSVSAGAFVTLLGPSGCGKTTCLRLLAGIQTPSSGEIRLNQRLVAGGKTFIPPEERRIGMVFQDYALFPHLNVAQNVAFGVRGPREAKQRRVSEMLALVGLAGYEDRMPYLLSGGQQQRVALARALAPQPDILLLDEPFSNLDTSLRAAVRAEVRSILRATGTTTVFVTHDQEEALSLSDRIAVLFEGELHQYGTPEELYNKPVNPRVAAFMGEVNLIPAEAEGGRARSALGEHHLLQTAQGAVKLLIRPERVVIEPSNRDGIAALVQWREYYGRSQRIGVQLGDGTGLTISTDTQVAYQVGDTVRVSVYAPLLAFNDGG